MSPDAGEQLTIVAPSTRSCADALKVTTAPVIDFASTVRSAGTRTAGGVVSTTVTVKVDAATLPVRSVAVQVTVVMPTGNLAPDAGTHLTATGPSMSSTAVGLVYVAGAPDAAVASTERFDGVLTMTGGV